MDLAPASCEVQQALESSNLGCTQEPYEILRNGARWGLYCSADESHELEEAADDDWGLAKSSKALA